MKSLYRKPSRIFQLLISRICLILILHSAAYAIEITRVIVTGNTIDFDTITEIRNTRGDLSKKDIENLGVKITNAYNEQGYTTSYVDKLILRGSGILEIHVKESKILDISITGVTGYKAREIKEEFAPLKNRVYNKYSVQRTASIIRGKYGLGNIKIYPVNYKDSGDVFLSVRLQEEIKGDFYGGIGYEPIYGITPELGYYYPFTGTSLNLFATAGYGNGRFRKAEGDLRFFFFSAGSSGGLYAGTKISMFIDQWESRDIEYKRTSLSPLLGYRYFDQSLVIDLYFNEIITDLENYNDDDETFRDYDSRLTLDITYSNRSALLSKREATEIKLSSAAGISDVSEKVYVISSGEIRTTAAPLVWLRFIPRLYTRYTSSAERYYWAYVYDIRLLGFFDDYSASKWKNTAGLDIEFELVPRFIYAGPFINTGYFLDEYDEWKQDTGTGAKLSINYKNTYFEIYYAWDISAGPSEGGLSVLAGGRF